MSSHSQTTKATKKGTATSSRTRFSIDFFLLLFVYLFFKLKEDFLPDTSAQLQHSASVLPAVCVLVI